MDEQKPGEGDEILTSIIRLCSGDGENVPDSEADPSQLKDKKTLAAWRERFPANQSNRHIDNCNYSDET